jgi:hypothetical protein
MKTGWLWRHEDFIITSGWAQMRGLRGGKDAGMRDA